MITLRPTRRFTVTALVDGLWKARAVEATQGVVDARCRRSDGWELTQIASPDGDLRSFVEELALEIDGPVLAADVDLEERVVLAVADPSRYAAVQSWPANGGSDDAPTEAHSLLVNWSRDRGFVPDVEMLSEALVAAEPFGEYVVTAALQALGVWPTPGPTVTVHWTFNLRSENSDVQPRPSDTSEESGRLVGTRTSIRHGIHPPDAAPQVPTTTHR